MVALPGAIDPDVHESPASSMAAGQSNPPSSTTVQAVPVGAKSRTSTSNAMPGPWLVTWIAK
jgi:hypothetical protein